jgi:TfoX/Sxy family transcriptional regulator of competence genes
MAYNEVLCDRIREVMARYANVEEKHMFGGVCFMLNDKMCVGVIKEDMMCRIGVDVYEAALEMNGCREMEFTSKAMKGYVYVSEEVIKTKTELEYWVGLCIAYNKEAKMSKKKSKGVKI